MTTKHEHYWAYEHTVWEGRDGFNGNEVAVVRSCKCGVRQIAYASDWQRLPKDHDANEVIDETHAVGVRP